MNGPTLPLTGCHLLAASCRHVFRRRHAVSRNNPLTSARKPSPSIATDHRLRLMRLGKRTAKATRSPLQAPESSSPCSKRARPVIGVSSSMTDLRARRLFWLQPVFCSRLFDLAISRHSPRSCGAAISMRSALPQRGVLPSNSAVASPGCFPWSRPVTPTLPGRPVLTKLGRQCAQKETGIFLRIVPLQSRQQFPARLPRPFFQPSM